MLELFIELTNQIFWDGYAEELSTENPRVFQFRFNEFLSTYSQPQSERATVRKPASLKSPRIQQGSFGTMIKTPQMVAVLAPSIGK